MSLGTLTSVDLSDAQFNKVARLVKSLCGIDLREGKMELVKARLAKRLRRLGLQCFDQYLDYVRNDSSGAELTAMLDALSTNKTSFFREVEHFHYLGKKVLPGLVAGGARAGRLAIWSAGCSSGEEPYSAAITVCESIPNVASWDVRVLATDISTRVLARAEEGVYEAAHVEPVPPMLRSRYFTCVETRPRRLHEVKGDIRGMVHFARLNLMGPWPMKGPFDVIFCRNVMIYFDRPSRERLIGRFFDLLSPGGTFFVGHSESLTGTRHQFRYMQPSVYEKP